MEDSTQMKRSHVYLTSEFIKMISADMCDIPDKNSSEEHEPLLCLESLETIKETHPELFV